MTYIQNHADRGLARLTHKLKEQPRVRAWLAALLSEVQGLEDAIEAMRQRSIAQSDGAQLDKWGRRLGQPRGGLENAAYRSRLHARLAVNRSSGTLPELGAILALLAGARPQHVLETYPMGLELWVDGDAVDAAESQEWVRLLGEARMGAVHGTLQWNVADEAETLHLNSSTSGQQLNEGNLAVSAAL